ncbi:Cation/hydrogen exchanger family protein [Euphorbia peplus]|nr:Cation/hydrogen exchanger family protein [Euphorbia peplus]
MEDFSIDYTSVNSTLKCMTVPLRSNSHGIVGSFFENTHFLTYRLPLLELQIAIILFVSHLLRYFLKPFGISDFISCILTGIVLGPNVLGKFDFMRDVIFPFESQEILDTITNLGYNLYMFLAAVKMEVGMVLKTGSKALSIGITSMAIPFVTSYTYAKIPDLRVLALRLEDIRLMIVVLSICLPVVANLVDHDKLKLANTELGRLALASGLVAEVTGIGIFLIQVFLSTQSLDATMRSLLPILFFVLSLAFIFRPVVNWIIKNMQDGKPLSTTLVYAIMALAIVSQVYFITLQYDTNFGTAPFLIGLALPAGPPLGSALVEKFETFTNGLLMQILIPATFMRADLYLIITRFKSIKKSLVVMVSAFLLKMVSCIIPCLMFKMPLNEAAATAFILSYTGIVHLTRAAISRDNRSYRPEVYSLAVMYILLNAILVPIIIRKLYNPSRRYDGNNTRNVLSLKPRAELKILMCIYGQDTAGSSIKLLDTINPTRESPVGIFAHHLVELGGRYVPLLISHSKHKAISTNTSQKIIYDFNEYEKNNWDSVSVQLFTSLSSFPLMHEDIVNISHEKKISLIILPLHRRWSVHGVIESEEIGWRNVNCSVLEKAPCSVAMFFSRGSLVRQRSRQSFSTNISVCIIFIGGNDDREAITLAKRMLKESGVTLIVVHFLQKNDPDEDDSEDHMYDVLLLDDLRKMAMEDERVHYRPHVVEDGPETIRIVRSMANQYDMFIVGRRYGVSSPQTSGLAIWNELPELGVIGDLFASKDLATRASVLVVQQQKLN